MPFCKSFVQSPGIHSGITPNIQNPIIGKEQAFRPRLVQAKTKAVRTAIKIPLNLSWQSILPDFSLRNVPVELPHHDKRNTVQRRQAIANAREEYQWTRDGVSDASLIKGLPELEIPTIYWSAKMAYAFFRVLMNDVGINIRALGKELTGSYASFLSWIYPLLLDNSHICDGTSAIGASARESQSFAGNSRVRRFQESFTDVGAFEEFKSGFISLKTSSVVARNQFLNDDIFGWYRVAGPNPMSITKLRGSPTLLFPGLTNKIFRNIPGFAGDTLEEAQRENRFFYLDYRALSEVSDDPPPSRPRKNGYYTYAPKCLLAIPRNANSRTSILPVAIQCGQDSTFPMYTGNSKHTDPVTWIAAKLTVQIADSNMHQCVYHLGLCHLLLEVFVCATHRALAPTHPLYKLLINHFSGTAYINYAALDNLLSDGGIIDQITAQSIEASKDIAAKAVNSSSFSFNSWMPDVEMESRGVLGADRLNFPYRDDSMKLWRAINKWVRSYLKAFYKSDADVVGDYELAAWCEEIVEEERGNLRGFGETSNGQIKTLTYLVRAVSMIIFTASVQHAAVNFPQSTLMQFVPAMPLCGFAPPPKTAKPFRDLNHLVEEMMPSFKLAQLQMNTAELIGVLRYTRLGEYGSSLPFASEGVTQALHEFREELRVIGAEVRERNAQEKLYGLPMYNYLDPHNIPQSINV